MKYQLNLTNYGDPKVYKVNRLEPRSYFIPFANAKEEAGVDLLHKRYSSSLVQCLNGEWDFKYYHNPNDLPADFDTDAVDFDKIPVPSCWQYIQRENENGGVAYPYGKPAYINLRYPFRYNPPYVPTTEPVTKYFSCLDGFIKAPEGEYNHVGVYRTFFNAKPKTDYIISFLGVCSCIDVYLNGEYIGYSEGSHNTAEFDLGQAVTEGQNELVCVVHRWCTGTYLEAQDMFRNNGIFRDVLLREVTPNDIWDIRYYTKKTEKGYTVTCYVVTESFQPVTVQLVGPNVKIAQKAIGNGECVWFEFENLMPNEWTAETPVLYDLTIENENEFIHQRVGFKHVAIKGTKFLVNGRLVKLHGVNHHDTNPEHGYTMTPAELERDVKLCKEYNIDTIRTSHYPPDPLLIELCAEYGIYVVDETDLETHGAYIAKFPPNDNRISNNKWWLPRYMDRTEALYERDKLISTPIIMWSLGNEAGAGCNTNATYAYLKKVSPIPVQYEGAVHKSDIYAYDVASQMYPAVNELHRISTGTHKVKQYMDRPFFMCEYAHAMGVGPGNIEGYWDEIYAHENLIGGCIWEMNDHAVLEKTSRGMEYLYGGDHGEWLHDKNFCADGIFYPDRTPSTGARIAKHAYTPIRIRLVDGHKLELLNTRSFTSGSQYELRMNLMHDDEVVARGIYYPNAEPLQKDILEVNDLFRGSYNLSEKPEGNWFVNIGVYEADGGVKRDETQVVLSTSNLQPAFKEARLPSWFTVSEERANFGLDLRTASEGTLLYRAGTDNDKHLFFFTTMDPWYKQEIKLLAQSETEEQARFTFRIKANQNEFEETDTYRGIRLKGGREAVLVNTKLTLVKGNKKGTLPRFAKVLHLPVEYTNVKWFGATDESYPDMRVHTRIAVNEAEASQMTEPNIRPQESGLRMDTQWVEFTGGQEKYRIEAVDKPFALNVKRYSDRRLLKMTHRADEEQNATYIALNAFQQGIGTGSCGPEVLPEHTFKADAEYELNYLIIKA